MKDKYDGMITIKKAGKIISMSAIGWLAGYGLNLPVEPTILVVTGLLLGLDNYLKHKHGFDLDYQIMKYYKAFKNLWKSD